MNPKKKGLGRGLDALLGSHTSDDNSEITLSGEQPLRGGVSEISIYQIEANPNQPRDLFDEEAMTELTQSIISLGIIQPITVRKLERDKYQIISGERRYRAAQRAGLQHIPAYIREANDNQVFEMALVENIQRSDLNAIEVALSYQKLIEDFSLKMEDLAAKIGKNRTTVNNFLRLLKLPDMVQFALKQRKITTGHARAIINVENDDDKLSILNDIIEKDLSVRQVEDIARVLNSKNQHKKPKEKPELPERYITVIEHIEKKYRTKVNLKMNETGKGAITINFNGDYMLDDIIDKLK